MHQGLTTMILKSWSNALPMASEALAHTGLLCPCSSNDQHRCHCPVDELSAGPHCRACTQASFSAIDLHISGCKFAWLYNIVVQLAHRQVRDLVTREVQTQVALLLPTQVNQVLAVSHPVFTAR